MRDGWAEVAFRDLCRLVVDRRDASDVDGVPYVGLEHMPSGSPAIRAPGTTNGLASQVVAFQPNDILFGRLRPYLRKVARPDFAGVCSPEILVLRPVADRVLPGYLYALAASDPVIRWAVSASAGSRMPRTTASDLLAFRVPLPPLAEQRRIVDLIGAVDDHAATCRRVAATVTSAYHALLDDVYEEASAAGPLVPLGHVAATRLGKMLDAKRLIGDAYPYLANVNVQWDEVRTSGLKTVPLTQREREELTLVAGDVLVCEGGEAGRSAALSHDIPGVAFQKAVHRVRCGALLLPRFLMHFMRYATRNGVLDEFLSALTIQHLTGEKLRRIPVPLPPLAAQDSAIATLDAVAAVARRAADCDEATARLRSALLADLLSGEHEIPASYDRFLDGAA